MRISDWSSDVCSSDLFGKPLMNSVFTLGLVVGLSVQDTTLGTTVGNLGWEEVAFPKPVFAGDTLRTETEVIALRESKSRPERGIRSEEHTSELQSLMRISYAVLCLKKKQSTKQEQNGHKVKT